MKVIVFFARYDAGATRDAREGVIGARREVIDFAAPVFQVRSRYAPGTFQASIPRKLERTRNQFALAAGPFEEITIQDVATALSVYEFDFHVSVAGSECQGKSFCRLVKARSGPPEGCGSEVRIFQKTVLI